MPTIPEADTKIDTDLPTNSVGQITAARLRGVLHYITSVLGTGGTVTSGAVPEVTRAIMQTLTFTSPPDSIRTNGFNEVGIGGAFYVKAPGNVKPNSFWPDSGTLLTADGTLYLITPENGELWVEQFGAKGRLYSDLTDQWQYFEDCKYVILMQPNLTGFQGVGGAIDMRIGRGCFYLTKAHSIEGNSYNIKGSGQSNGGTVWRNPPGVDGIQIQHGYAEGNTFGHEGEPLSGAQRRLNQLQYVAGQTHVYQATNTGTPNLASPPTGTGPGTITSGSATFTYVRERTWSESHGGAASYAVVSDILMWSTWTHGSPLDPTVYDENLTNPDGAFHSGIVMRTRATIQDVTVQQYAGHGIAVVADGDAEVRGAGNVNGWVLRRIRAYYNGHAGIRIGAADANAGMGQDIDTAYNERAGVEDFNFLGNRWLNIQDAFSGSFGNTGGKFMGGVTYNGYSWIAMAPEIGGTSVFYTNAPGTDQFSWTRTNGSGAVTPSTNFPAWSATPPSTVVYAPCGSFISNNQNSENQIIGLYVEGGGYGCQLGVYDSVWGGPMGNTPDVTRGGQLYMRNIWLNGLVCDNNFSFDSGPKNMRTYFGGRRDNGGFPGVNPDTTVWGYTDWENHTVKLAVKGQASTREVQNLDMFLQDTGNSNFMQGWTGATTLLSFGRASPVPLSPVLPRLILGSGASSPTDPSYTVIETTTSNLGTGTTAATGKRNGEIVFYVSTSATSSDPTGWKVRGGFYIPFG